MCEIITKAVIGKKSEKTTNDYYLSIENNLTAILGCWIINHAYSRARNNADSIEIKGSFDINVWYSYDNNTKTDVLTKRITYTDFINVSCNITETSEILVKCLKQPSVKNTKIGNRKMKITIFKELEVEVIDEARFFIKE